MEEIQKIHNSSLFGVIIETGAGASITNRLLSESGGSKTLYYTNVPYAKDFEQKKYGFTGRSVSEEFVRVAAAKEFASLDTEEKERVNFILVSSAQVASEPGVITHVWMCLYDTRRGMSIVVHYTMHKTTLLNRKAIADEIGNIGTQLIASLIKLEGTAQLDERIAAINTPAILDVCHFYWPTTTVMSSAPVIRLEKSNIDYVLAYMPPKNPSGKGRMMRVEELFRHSDKIVINKGSFDPLHHKHVEVLNTAAGMCPECTPVFLISTYRYDKPHVSWDELLPRITSILHHGYAVLICKEPLFYNTFDLVKKYAGPEKKFYFTIGSDTLNRIFDADTKDLNVGEGHKKIKNLVNVYSDQFKFVVFDRQGFDLKPETQWYTDMVIYAHDYHDDGTSSTKIRNGEINNGI